MPGRFSLTLETPALAAPAGWEGPILDVVSASVQRQVNRAGTFTITVPMAAGDASAVKVGWRVTLRQERRGAVNSAGAAQAAVPLLYRGKVLRPTPIVNDAGATMLVLEGETFLGSLADAWIQTGTVFTHQTLNAILSSLLTPLGVTWSVPPRCTTDTITIELSDMSVLAGLIRLAEFTRTNLSDGFDGVIRFLDEDRLPDPAINVCLDDPVLRIVNLERSSLGTAAAAQAGFAIVAGVPVIAFDGSELVNKLKVVGVDFDNSELTLEGAEGGNYTIHTGAGPVRNFFYIEDTASRDKYGPVESQLVRSDVKNPNDDPLSRAQAKRVLAAIATGEMLRRRSEIMTLQVDLLNGEDIYAKPGERAYVRYKGRAIRDGATTDVDLDLFCLIARRGDRIGEGGLRLVSLDLTSPELQYAVPSLPDLTAKPTPRDNQLPPARDPGGGLVPIGFDGAGGGIRGISGPGGGGGGTLAQVGSKAPGGLWGSTGPGGAGGGGKSSAIGMGIPSSGAGNIGIRAAGMSTLGASSGAGGGKAGGFSAIGTGGGGAGGAGGSVQAAGKSTGGGLQAASGPGGGGKAGAFSAIGTGGGAGGGSVQAAGKSTGGLAGGNAMMRSAGLSTIGSSGDGGGAWGAVGRGVGTTGGSAQIGSRAPAGGLQGATGPGGAAGGGTSSAIGRTSGGVGGGNAIRSNAGGGLQAGEGTDGGAGGGGTSAPIGRTSGGGGVLGSEGARGAASTGSSSPIGTARPAGQTIKGSGAGAADGPDFGLSPVGGRQGGSDRTAPGAADRVGGPGGATRTGRTWRDPGGTGPRPGGTWRDNMAHADEVLAGRDDLAPGGVSDPYAAMPKRWGGPTVPLDPAVTKYLLETMHGQGALQPCCADKHIGVGPPAGPPDPVDDPGIPTPIRACYAPFIAAAVQDFRFVNKWGEGWAAPGLGGIDGAIHPTTDRAVVVLVSSSADPVLVVTGATPTLLAAYDSSSPANFGGDGHTWWRFYYLVPTADLIDFTGTTGVTRNVTFFRAGATIVSTYMIETTESSSGGGTITANRRRKRLTFGTGIVDGVDYQFNSNLEYHGSSFGEAIEEASANNAGQYGDAVWFYINSVYRSIDDITFTKEFNAPEVPFNHDYALHNAEFVTFTPGGGAASATDWSLSDSRDDGFAAHSYTCRFTGDAVASDFPGACRILVLAASIRLRALCESHLID